VGATRSDGTGAIETAHLAEEAELAAPFRLQIMQHAIVTDALLRSQEEKDEILAEVVGPEA